jgi:hypothetical protein
VVRSHLLSHGGIAQSGERQTEVIFVGLTGAMVARLPTEQEVVGSSPTLGFVYGVFGLQSVKIRHTSFCFPAFLAQSAERCANNFSKQSLQRSGRRFDPGRKLFFCLVAVQKFKALRSRD